MGFLPASARFLSRHETITAIMPKRAPKPSNHGRTTSILSNNPSPLSSTSTLYSRNAADNMAQPPNMPSKYFILFHKLSPFRDLNADSVILIRGLPKAAPTIFIWDAASPAAFYSLLEAAAFLALCRVTRNIICQMIHSGSTGRISMPPKITANIKPSIP